MIRVSLAILSLIVCGTTVLAQQSPLDMLTAAETAFDEGLALLDDNETLARLKFEEAAAMYRAIQREHGLGGADLFTNAGNASLLAGDVGRAIIAYRQALTIEPTHRGALAGLAQARSRVSIAAPEDVKKGGWFVRMLKFVPRVWAVGAGLTLWAVGWGLVLARLGRLRYCAGGRVPTWSIAACLGTAGLVAGVVAADIVAARDADDAVVIATEVHGHNGPDSRVYPRTFEQSLSAGVEGRVRESRRGWVRFRLGDGRETWLPASAVEMIRNGV